MSFGVAVVEMSFGFNMTSESSWNLSFLLLNRTILTERSRLRLNIIRNVVQSTGIS